MIGDRIIIGIRDSSTHQDLLKVRKLTLAQCTDLRRAVESAVIRNKVVNPNKICRMNVIEKKTRVTGKRKCKFCGLNHAFKEELCPAYGKKCVKCLQPNNLLLCALRKHQQL